MNFKISLNEDCEKCVESSHFKAFISAFDSSVFLELEKSNRQPSLISSVFLKNEVYNHAGDFLFWHHYIDHMFVNSDQLEVTDENVDLLLGIQKERKFLFNIETPQMNFT